MRTRSATRGTLAGIYRMAMLGLSLTLAACDQDSGEQAVSLVDWSPDRSMAALVPNFMEEDPGVSGIWVYDFKAGSTTHIFAAPEGGVCTHPQWSPAGDELLFGMVFDPEDDSSESEESIAFSVYAIRPDGQALRRLADSQTTNPENFVMRNAISWGPTSGTILFQQSAGDRVTAMQLDLESGEVRQYLPDFSDSYSLEPSPDRRRVAALLYYKESDSARLYVADFAATAWSFVETLEVDGDKMKTHSQVIYWSPDSTQFVVPERAKAAAGEEHAGGYLRLFDVLAGSSRRFFAGEPSPTILWNRDSSALVFAMRAGSEAGIYQADLSSGNVSMIVPGPENHLLSWNQQDGRIYFFRTHQTEASRPADTERLEHRLFSCDADGNGGRTLGRFYTSGKPYWNLSPDGNQMVLFEDTEAPDLLFLATGGTDRIRLQDGPVWP